MKYAQTHDEVLRPIPDGACVVLIPGLDSLFDQKSLVGLLQTAGLTPGTPIACVHLTFAEYPYSPGESALPPITEATVEVFPTEGEHIAA